jgi:hypothetical protein
VLKERCRWLGYPSHGLFDQYTYSVSISAFIAPHQQDPLQAGSPAGQQTMAAGDTRCISTGSFICFLQLCSFHFSFQINGK